jgi:hypothetical protein
MTCCDTVIIVVSSVYLFLDYQKANDLVAAGHHIVVRDTANKVTPFGRLSLNDGTWCMLLGWV